MTLEEPRKLIVASPRCLENVQNLRQLRSRLAEQLGKGANRTLLAGAMRSRQTRIDNLF
jgi:hypothetical protein